MNTENIPEAEIDLKEELNTPTETKTASSATTSAWNFDEDPEEETAPVNNENAGENNNENKTAPNANTVKTKPESKVTDKAKRASARTAIGMLNLLQKSIFPPILNHKFQKKFNDDEKEKMFVLQDRDKKELEGEDLALRNKFDRLMKAHMKKIEAVPFTETEEKDLEEAFYTYFDYKEKTLPPEWFVGMTIANAIGKRTIDCFTK